LFSKIHKQLHWGVDKCDKLSLAICFLRWVESVLQQSHGTQATVDQIMEMFGKLPISNLNSKANLITKTKNLVKKIADDELYQLLKKTFNLTKQEKKVRDRQLELARFQKSEKCLPFDFKQISTITKKYSHSDLWQRRAIAVALATGLRQQEILKTARIVKKNGTHIWLKGLLKKRNDDTEYSRPTIFLNPDEVAALMSELQDISTRNVPPSTISSSLVKEVRKTFGKDWTFHRLRAAYCHLSFKELATSESLPCWIHKVLNHNSNTMINALFYCNVKQTTDAALK
jgi:hypothetical protein